MDVSENRGFSPPIIHGLIGIFHFNTPSILGGIFPPIFAISTHITTAHQSAATQQPSILMSPVGPASDKNCTGDFEKSQGQILDPPDIPLADNKFTLVGWWFFTNPLFGGFSPTHPEKYDPQNG